VNRALRAAAIGVLLIAPVALSACSAGQVNQTSSQNRDKVGATARVNDILLRGVQLAYPRGGTYASGQDAVLNAAIVNTGNATDTLVSITGDGFTGVDVTGTGAQGSVASGTASTSTAAAPTTAATTTGAATTGAATSGAGTGAATGTTGATTTVAVPTEAPSNDVGIKIPGNSAIFLGQNAPHVTLTGLTDSLNVAQTLRVVFTFQRAGAVTVDLLVANPSSEVPNTSSFNFEQATQGNVPDNEAGGGIKTTSSGNG
jgi:copper(I)-binding protein